MIRRDLIRQTALDLGPGFLGWDRKDDEELPEGVIEAALAAGEVTQEELFLWLKLGLEGALSAARALMGPPVPNSFKLTVGPLTLSGTSIEEDVTPATMHELLVTLVGPEKAGPAPEDT